MTLAAFSSETTLSPPLAFPLLSAFKGAEPAVLGSGFFPNTSMTLPFFSSPATGTMEGAEPMAVEAGCWRKTSMTLPVFSSLGTGMDDGELPKEAIFFPKTSVTLALLASPTEAKDFTAGKGGVR